MAMVETEKHGQVMVIRLNRPERLNALGAELRQGMAEAWCEFRDSDQLEVAVFTGTGRAFCAGEDMKESLERGAPGSGSGQKFENPFMDGTLQKPVIGAINGYAMGGGFMLVERTDLRVAVKGAIFEMSEAKRWLLGGYNHGYVAGMPHPIATEMALGYRFTADRLYQVGFINRLVEPDELLPTALEMAEHSADLAARGARQYRLHDASDDPARRPGVAAPGRGAARPRRQERFDGIARRLCRKAQAQFQGLERPCRPLPPADARRLGAGCEGSVDCKATRPLPQMNSSERRISGGWPPPF